MQLGQIPYIMKQKRAVQYWSMRWIEQKINTEGVITDMAARKHEISLLVLKTFQE